MNRRIQRNNSNNSNNSLRSTAAALSCSSLFHYPSFIICSIIIIISVLLVAAADARTVHSCYLIFSDVSDLGYSYAHNIGRRDAYERFLTHLSPAHTEINEYYINAYEGNHMEIVGNYVAHGCDLIVATAPEFAEAMLFHADRNQNVTFAVEEGFPFSSGYDRPNVVVYGAATYENWYSMGVAAALEASSLSTPCIGLLLAWEKSFEIIAPANAFLLGVTSVSASMPVHIVPMQNWGWSEGEAMAVRALHNLTKCNVFAHYTDEGAVSKFAAQNGGVSFHLHTSGAEFYGDTVLTSSISHWDVIFYHLTSTIATTLPPGAAMNGAFYWGVSAGMVSLDPLSPRANPSTRRAVAVVVEAIRARTFSVFCNNTHLSGGAVCLTEEQIRHQDSYVGQGHVMHSKFQYGPEVCAPGNYFTYELLVNNENKMGLVCTPCAQGTYASPVALLGSCASCPEGSVSSDDRTLCLDASDDTNARLFVTLLLSVGLPLTFLLIVVPMVLFYIFVFRRYRSVRHAPTSVPCGILFTDVASSTKLWSECPVAMADAMDVHHRAIRAVISRHKAYEVKTLGDAFMIATCTADELLAVACDIQLELQNAVWPSEICDFNKKDDTEENRHGTSSSCCEGLRVRVGMHFGRPDIFWDDNAKGFDYFGAEVAIAAKVEAMAYGGQILCTSAVVASNSGDNASPWLIRKIGEIEVAPNVFLYTVTPLALRHRVFPETASCCVTGTDESVVSSTHHASLSSGSDGDDALFCGGTEDAARFPRSYWRAVRHHPAVARGTTSASELHDLVQRIVKMYRRVFILFPQADVENMVNKLCVRWRVNNSKSKRKSSSHSQNNINNESATNKDPANTKEGDAALGQVILRAQGAALTSLSFSHVRDVATTISPSISVPSTRSASPDTTSGTPKSFGGEVVIPSGLLNSSSL
eukprot:PhM_4_TR2330/c0_g1_i1/m.50027